ncbi:hypothetical protein T440DRAFT_481791 [Plenodomus tracheiphilus IPT5]|uniref:Suppressor of anucleate metulae protein B n=1 Tax=Plenodomus tracheiphilus IPT5 TaxID=1408161 RepID=A0A6A7AYB3_9PLEO|nr:hypothetical protein T440DRAFT_481791 [Plenodomus tracheiphilus IPT5]
MQAPLPRTSAHLDSEMTGVKDEPRVEHPVDRALTLPRSMKMGARPHTHNAETPSNETEDRKPINLAPPNPLGSLKLDVLSHQTPSILAGPERTSPCLMCPSQGKVVCDVCNYVAYCTPACKDADVEARQTLCHAHTEFEQRPSEAMRRTIYFPESSTESIRFTWVKIQEAWTEDDERYETALIGGYFNVAQNQRASYYVTENSVLCRPFTRTLRIITANDDSSFSQINPSVAKHINGRYAYPWKGPLLAIALQGTATNPRLPLGDDVALEDLRHVLDFLNAYCSRAVSTDFDRYFGCTVRGVRINSVGDQRSVELPREFEAVRVPTTHAVFHQTDPAILPIAKDLEIPIIHAKYPRRSDRGAICENEKLGVRESDWNSAFRDLKQSWLLRSQEDFFAAAAHIRVHEDDMVAEYYGGSAILVRQDEVKKRVGSLKRNSSSNFFARVTKKAKWEWTSDCDEESAGEMDTVNAPLWTKLYGVRAPRQCQSRMSPRFRVSKAEHLNLIPVTWNILITIYKHTIGTMAHLQYSAYQGVGERNLKRFGYQQAVRVGDRIECAGQGGWHPETGAYSDSLEAHVDQAFANVDLCLKDAGGKGWSQVYRVNSYHVPLDDEALELMTKGFKKWMPDHSPIWTCVGVVKLGEDDMKVEIEVVAHDPKSCAQ